MASPTIEEVLDYIQKYTKTKNVDRNTLAAAVESTIAYAKQYGMPTREQNGSISGGFVAQILTEYSARQGIVPNSGGGGGSTTEGGGPSPWGGIPEGEGGGGETGLTERQKEQRKEQRQQANFNQEQGFAAQVSGFGLKLSSNLQTLITEGNRKNWTQTTFLNFLRQTPEYRQRFPGIFSKDGTLKMSESQYIQTEQQYQTIAAQSGINMGPQKMADLFRGNVSTGEFEVKADAISRVRTDPTLLHQLSQVVGTKVTKGEAYKFIIGEGNSEWYSDWNKTIARNAAVQAGINLKGGKYTSLGEHLVEKYGLKGISEDVLKEGFEQIADTLLSTFPDSQIQGMNLQKKDIVAAFLGGKGSAKARSVIQRVEKTTEAYSDEERGDADILQAQTRNRYGGQGA